MADLEMAIELAGETSAAVPSYLLKSVALWDLARAEEASAAGERGLERYKVRVGHRRQAYGFLVTVHESLGDQSRADELLDGYRMLTGTGAEGATP